MTNTQRMSKTVRLAIAGAAAVAVLGAGAVAAEAATSAAATTSTAVPASTATVSVATTATTAAVSSRQAIRIAKKRVPGARVTKVEREWEHGHRTWKVELQKGHTEYRVYVSVRTGKIIKFRRKHDH
ncbi:PepSY domain-containing protein [Sphaerisporangium corydalis]|uniref:PepSY domain-containing protein n=1 Tax=Sphaerisporangium corydalis TaxID=1441875 RepID=A0ABV9E8M2_9ACTN|nr:PepSY domain-containing protein [Sphaerisporangium corydalis]